MPFQFKGLAQEQFRHLFGLDDKTLESKGVFSYIADAKPGFPCRITLKDAEPGERLLLLNFEHLPFNSPYRSSHAIFIRDAGKEATCAPGEVPDMVKTRLVSIRSFDRKGMMLDVRVCAGSEASTEIGDMFTPDAVDFCMCIQRKRVFFSLGKSKQLTGKPLLKNKKQNNKDNLND